MLPVLFVIALIFLVLFVGRVGGARRAELLRQWPAVLFATAAIVAISRGAIWPAIALGGLSLLSWSWWPTLRRRFSAPSPLAASNDPEDARARAILGLGPTATSSDIRSAYRSKMARAHPDRGGSHAEAARLTAARDRLLNKKT